MRLPAGAVRSVTMACSPRPWWWRRPDSSNIVGLIGNGGQSEMSGVCVKRVEDTVGAYPTFGRVDKDFICVVHLVL